MSARREAAAGATPGDLLLHPLVIGSIGVLVVNDHLLKAAWPGPVTGKLSDVAGLVFFPILVVAVVELIGSRMRQGWSRSAFVPAAAIVATGVVFAAVKVDPAWTGLYAAALGTLQWPFLAAGSLLVGGDPRPPIPVSAITDPGDLLALPSLAIAWLVARRGMPRRGTTIAGRDSARNPFSDGGSSPRGS